MKRGVPRNVNINTSS